MRLRQTLIILACIWTVGAGRVLADDIAFQVNASRTPGYYLWDGRVTSVGYHYVPSESYDLTRVETHFRSNLGGCSERGYARTVTVEILTDRPVVGGELLGRCQFDSSAATGQLGGCSFANPIPLEAGTLYFIGFRNMQLLGVQFTEEPGAEQLCPDDNGGALDNDALGNYDVVVPCPGLFTQPVLRLFKPSN